jgi:protoheme IX farnesyltransferase
MEIIKEYYRLTKPGIIYGNLVSAIAGFMLASQGQIDLKILFVTLIGLGFVIGAACVFNNILDRSIDAKMPRTKKRALVTKKITISHAFIFGKILLIAGCAILYLFTNLLTMITALLGFIFYVIVYGFSKRKTPFSVEIGSIAGATPPVVGYLAVTDKLDMIALLLFLILVFWQMPHFFAIAIFRKAEYAKTKLPIVSLKRSFTYIRLASILYTMLFIASLIGLYFIKATGTLYAIGALVISFMVIRAVFFSPKKEVAWAGKVFKAYMYALILWLVAIYIDSLFKL